MVPAIPDLALAPSHASLPVAGPRAQIFVATPLRWNIGNIQHSSAFRTSATSTVMQKLTTLKLFYLVITAHWRRCFFSLITEAMTPLSMPHLTNSVHGRYLHSKTGISLTTRLHFWDILGLQHQFCYRYQFPESTRFACLSTGSSCLKLIRRRHVANQKTSPPFFLSHLRIQPCSLAFL